MKLVSPISPRAAATAPAGGRMSRQSTYLLQASGARSVRLQADVHRPAEAGRYGRSANAKRELPAATVTYCLPLTEYVIGPLFTCPPSATFQSRSPERASSAKKYPSLPPLNSTSDAVVSTPPHVMSFILNSHFVASVFGSSARTAP